MSLSLPNPLLSLASHRAHSLATLWVISRRDNQKFRFTTHDTKVQFNDGTSGNQDFQPAGAWDGMAVRREEGLKDQESQNRGALTSSEITYADLEAGLYREAEVVEYQVDPRFPWGGSFRTLRYWILDTTFDGEKWNAELMGVTGWMSHRTGRVGTRTCSADLFDSRCGVLKSDEAYYEVTGVRPLAGTLDANEPQRKFALVFSDIPSSGPRETEYKHGSITWTAGDNAGLVSEIKSYGHTSTASQRDIELYLPTPYPIDPATDEGTIISGCDRARSTCNDHFDNLANCRCLPFMPGTDDLLKTPDAPR